MTTSSIDEATKAMAEDGDDTTQPHSVAALPNNSNAIGYSIMESDHSPELQSVPEGVLSPDKLKAHLTIDDETRATFQRVSRLASRVLRVPKAYISMVNLSGGLTYFGGPTSASESHAFVGQASLQELLWVTSRAFAHLSEDAVHDRLLVVLDVNTDERFAMGRPLLEDQKMPAVPAVTFYACIGLTVESQILGTLSVASPEPRGSLKSEEISTLQDLADIATHALSSGVEFEGAKTEASRPSKGPTRQQMQEESKDKEKIKSLIASTSHSLFTPLMGVELSLSLLNEDSSFMDHFEERQHFRDVFLTAVSLQETDFLCDGP